MKAHLFAINLIKLAVIAKIGVCPISVQYRTYAMSQINQLSKFAQMSFFLSGLTAEIDDCLKIAAISEISQIGWYL